MNPPYESTTHFKDGSVARRTEAGTAQRIYTVAASLDGLGMNLLRLGLVIVLVWIGGLLGGLQRVWCNLIVFFALRRTIPQRTA